MKKRWQLLLAPAAVLAILSVVFLMSGLFPFGVNTLSWCDMNQQVIPLMMDFKDILAGKTGLLLNLQNAGGMSFWAVLLFFLSSPFSLLTAFVPKADMYIFMNVLVLLKLALCAFTASLFLKKQFAKLDLLQTVALASSYALCGYGMFYFQNIVWLDMMALFPMLMLGFLSLLRERKPMLFLLSLAGTLVINFYLSYMVVMFIVLALGAYLLLCVPKRERGIASAWVGVAAVIAALLTAVVWLPALAQYLQSARTGDLLSNLSADAFFARLDTTLPTVLLCTPCIIAAIPAFFLQRSKNRDSLCMFVLFLLMLIPAFIEPINKMWHTGSYQAFPARYGYISVLLGVAVLAAALSGINKAAPTLASYPLAQFFGFFACGAVLGVGITLLSGYYYEAITVYTRTLWGSAQALGEHLFFALAAALAMLLLLLLFRFRLLSRRSFSLFFCALVAMCCLFSARVYVGSATSPDTGYRQVMSLENRIDDRGFYRVKSRQKYFDANLMGSLGYRTTAHYTSLISEGYMFAMKKLGYSSYWMEVNSAGGTELTDALLGNKYELVLNGEPSAGQKTVYDDGIFFFQTTPIAMDMGLVLHSDDIASLQSLSEGTRMERQQRLFEAAFHTNEQLITEYPPTRLDSVEMGRREDGKLQMNPAKSSRVAPGVVYEIDVQGTQTLYFDCFDLITSRLVEHVNESVAVLVNDEPVSYNYPTKDSNGLLNLGTFKNEKVTVSVRVRKYVEAASLGVWGLRRDTLAAAASGAVTANLRETGAGIAGLAMGSGEDSYLFLPIAYDKGFSASVNGKPAQIYPVFDAFMAVKLEAGENGVFFSYAPSGFLLGVGVSVLGLALLLLFVFLLRAKRLRWMKYLQRPALWLVWVLSAGVFLLLYIFPVAVYLIKS